MHAQTRAAAAALAALFAFTVASQAAAAPHPAAGHNIFHPKGVAPGQGAGAGAGGGGGGRHHQHNGNQAGCTTPLPGTDQETDVTKMNPKKKHKKKTDNTCITAKM